MDETPLPPWQMYPDIPFGSIGWRMGPGEDALCAFYQWFAELNDVDAAEFVASNPAPDDDWRDWCRRIRADDWD
ncbi:hypothetical protein [Sphingomonas sp.]|uniref:hypothetical protein n=1 Tax=Sphingomonas sp. TaxID=28214 RepID=UPI003BAB2933